MPNPNYQSHIDYQYLKQCSVYEVMLITQEKVIIVKRNMVRDASEAINRLLITRAKDKIKNEE